MLHSVILVAVIAAVTIFLRFMPFIVFRKKVPEYVSYLGKVLPEAVMGMLVIYCLKGVSFGEISGWIPPLAASGIVIILQVWKRKTLLSILGGTLSYMAMINFM